MAKCIRTGIWEKTLSSSRTVKPSPYFWCDALWCITRSSYGPLYGFTVMHFTLLRFQLEYWHSTTKTNRNKITRPHDWASCKTNLTFNSHCILHDWYQSKSKHSRFPLSFIILHFYIRMYYSSERRKKNVRIISHVYSAIFIHPFFFFFRAWWLSSNLQFNDLKT